MVYFAFLALSVVSVLALGTFLALMVKYPGSSAALADVEKDFLLKRRVVSESMARSGSGNLNRGISGIAA